MPATPSDIKNRDLADEGLRRIGWALAEMPVVRSIMDRFVKEQPLQGIHISACLHITTETANLARTLKAGGADLVLCASNPLSTQDDVAAALVHHFQIPVFAINGESPTQYYQHIQSALDHQPVITLDDGADLVTELHRHHQNLVSNMIGGTEETTTGVIRLRAMAQQGALLYPVIAVNDAQTKHFFDNRHGTGQSALDGIIRATNLLLAGRVFTVVGYGWCGRGIAMRAKGHGSQVIVTEVDPLRALEAAMDGYRVMPLCDAAAISDVMVTATGNRHVIDRQHLEVMKDGCILANSGHFNVEINIDALQALSIHQHSPRNHVTAYEFADGKTLHLLAEGRLVNLAAAEGHPSAVMDMSFANQALVVEHLVQHKSERQPGVWPVPESIDQTVARLKLAAMDIAIDTLTDDQQRYLHTWQEGT